MLKVGDKVRVRRDLVIGKSYGDYGGEIYDEFRDHYKGLKMKIRSRQGGYYKFSGNVYWWPPEMLKPCISMWDKIKSLFLKQVKK
jgi:hypothetical protein